jgi:endonuclease YncB( thermonuclease family)
MWRPTYSVSLTVTLCAVLLQCFQGSLEVWAGSNPSFTGQVVGVTDGNSIKVLHDDKAEMVRLLGIDCPERKQPFGTRAKQFTSHQIFGMKVTVRAAGRDRYGRTVAEVILPDRRNLNHELLKAGLAWWYRKYSNDTMLGELEAEARKQKRGLWVEPHPVPPWEWRSESKKNKLNGAAQLTP